MFFEIACQTPCLHPDCCQTKKRARRKYICRSWLSNNDLHVETYASKLSLDIQKLSRDGEVNKNFYGIPKLLDK